MAKQSVDYKKFFELDESKQAEIIDTLHYKDLKSVTEISELIGTYPNKLRRMMIKMGKTPMNRSVCQKATLSTGKRKHPTLGTTRSKETKIKISENLAKSWENLSDEELQRRCDMAKELWDKKTEAEKAELYAKARAALLKTAKEGSKIEKLLKQELISNNFNVVSHQKHILANEKIHLDLFIPEITTVIEVDGPTHFQNIYGEDSLAKTRLTDNRKDGLVLGSGFCLIRILVKKNLTQKRERDILEQLMGILNSIKTQYPPVGSRRFVLGDK